MRKRGEESPGIFTVTEAVPDGRNVRSGQEVFPQPSVPDKDSVVLGIFDTWRRSFNAVPTLRQQN